jgi:RNA polymerase sigma-70 factor (ECF subfamily)
LRTDAAIELVGARTWFSGKATCLRYLAHVIGSPGDWLMIPTHANGQPAAATYHRTANGTHQALGVASLAIAPDGVTRITVFPGGPGLVARFGLPSSHLSGQSSTHPGRRSSATRPNPEANHAHRPL